MQPNPPHLKYWIIAITFKLCCHLAPPGYLTPGQVTEKSLAWRQMPPLGFCADSFLDFSSLFHPQLYEMFSSVMKHLPGPQQQAFKELQGLEDFITKKVEHNQRTLDPNSPRDFIDSFLIRMLEGNPEARECGRRFKAKEARWNHTWGGGDSGPLRSVPHYKPHTLTTQHHCSVHCSVSGEWTDWDRSQCIKSLVISTYSVLTFLGQGCAMTPILQMRRLQLWEYRQLVLYHSRRAMYPTSLSQADAWM